jgi:uncharacterized membrane protein
METRAKFNLILTPADRMLEMAGWVVLGVLWVLSIWSFSILPDTITIHFNASGQADGYGEKGAIFFLPAIGTIVLIGISKLSQYPHLFNFPFELTPENTKIQYSNALKMVRFMKISLALIFTLIVFGTIQSAQGKSDGLGTWFLPISLALTLIPMVYFIVKSYKMR